MIFVPTKIETTKVKVVKHICPKCTGTMEFTDSSQDDYGVKCKILRCINCGKILFTDIFNRVPE